MIGGLTLAFILETPELSKEPVDMYTIAGIDENRRLERYGLCDQGQRLLDSLRLVTLGVYGMLDVQSIQKPGIPTTSVLSPRPS